MGRSIHLIRLTQREWLTVAWRARQLLAGGATVAEALTAGKLLLPAARRQKRHNKSAAQQLQKALAVLATMSEAQQAELLEGVQLPPDSALPAFVPHGVHRYTTPDYAGRPPVLWSMLEWARLGRRVRLWLAAGSNVGLSRLLIEAQEIELPEDRRRSRAALGVAASKALAMMERAEAECAEELAAIPYDPAARTYTPPPPKVEPEVEPEQTMSQALQDAQAEVEATTPPPAPAEAPAAAPWPFPDAYPPAPQASTASTVARQFGEQLATSIVPVLEGLLESILAQHEQTILARVYEQQQAHAKQLAADMSNQLLSGLDRLLGAPPAPPTHAVILPVVEPPPAPAPTPAPAEPRHRVKFDVVGFEHGHHRVLLNAKLNGCSDLVDLKFVGPTESSSWEPVPTRHVILVTGRIPHKLQDKVKKAGVPMTRVGRSLGDVADAINRMLGHGTKGG